MALIRGDLLPERLRRQVLDAYGYRLTKENRARARKWYGKRSLPSSAAFKHTDAEWLRTHYFEVTRSGELSQVRRHAVPAALAE